MAERKDEIYQYEPLWGRWYIDLPIGRGSFGSVYKITREDMGKKYTAAVKIISVPTEEQYKEAEASFGTDESTLTGYFQDIVKNIVGEIDMLYALSGNTNIINYQDHEVVKKTDRIGWDILIRMEYVTSLKTYLRDRQMSRGEVIRLGMDICNAIETCSNKGIVHRDIKDENIFVNEDGVFKLGDFGIARELSKSGRAASMRGTPLYMAPEVMRGDRYDAAVDIYSLGIVLYKLLNHGRIPFMPPYPQEIRYRDSEEAMEKRLRGEPLPAPDMAGKELAEIIIKACAYKPEERYASAAEMRGALQAATAAMVQAELEEKVTQLLVSKAHDNALAKAPAEMTKGILGVTSPAPETETPADTETETPPAEHMPILPAEPEKAEGETPAYEATQSIYGTISKAETIEGEEALETLAPANTGETIPPVPAEASESITPLQSDTGEAIPSAQAEAGETISTVPADAGETIFPESDGDSETLAETLKPAATVSKPDKPFKTGRQAKGSPREPGGKKEAQKIPAKKLAGIIAVCVLGTAAAILLALVLIPGVHLFAAAPAQTSNAPAAASTAAATETPTPTPPPSPSPSVNAATALMNKKIGVVMPKNITVLDGPSPIKEFQTTLTLLSAPYNWDIVMREITAYDTNMEISIVKEFIAQGMNAIIAMPAGEASLPAYEEAKAAGIPVFFMLVDDFGGVFGKFDGVVRPDYQWMGRQCAQYLGETYPKGGTVILMQGVKGTYATEQMDEGFATGIASYPKMKVTAAMEVKFEPALAIMAMEDILAKGDKPDFVCCENDMIAMAVLTALQEKEPVKTKIITPECVLMGMDLIRAGAIEAGAMFPYGLYADLCYQQVCAYFSGAAYEKTMNVRVELTTAATVDKAIPLNAAEYYTKRKQEAFPYKLEDYAGQAN